MGVGLAHRSHNMSKSSEITLGGVFCGRQIAKGLFAEEVASNRYLIRAAAGPNHATRVGEVCGSPRQGAAGGYQALTMKGDSVAVKDSLRAAAVTLATKAGFTIAVAPVPFITARGVA